MDRFLIVSQDFLPDFGGTQTYALEMAGMFGSRFEVTVVAPTRPGSEEFDARAAFRVARTPGGLNAFAVRAIPTLTRLLKEGDVAGILCIQWNAAVAVRAAKRLAGSRAPMVLAAHGREILFTPFRSGIGTRFYARLRKWAVDGAAHVFAVSRYTAGLVEEIGVAPDLVSVVNNGVDPARFDPSHRADSRRRLGLMDEQVILTSCRLVQRKGVDVLIRSLARVGDRHPLARLWVLGNGPDQARLEALCADLDVTDKVRFVGRVEREAIAEYYQAADIFAMVPYQDPPNVEGFGLVYLEASACAVPNVGSWAGGISDAVLDGETGILVSEGAVDETADTFHRLLSDPDLRGSLGENGRRHTLTDATWARAGEDIMAHFV